MIRENKTVCLKVGEDFFKDSIIFFDKKFIAELRISMHKYFHIKEYSYFGILITRIFNYFFSNSINTYKHYTSFYKDEYKNIYEFLSKKYLLNKEEIKLLKEINLYDLDFKELNNNWESYFMMLDDNYENQFKRDFFRYFSIKEVTSDEN